MTILVPESCDDGSGLDVEDLVFCETTPEGEFVGSAIGVYTYDGETGLPVGPPTFVDPITGDPYVPDPANNFGPCSGGTIPLVIGSGCVSTGSGRYTAIRNPDGTVTLVDSVTGADVLAGNIIACPSDDSTRTIVSEGRLLAAGQSWTPGVDVTGTLTGVSFTVLTGTATVTDSNGTVSAGLPVGVSSSWSAEDQDTLTGPQSIAAVGGTIWVTWTSR